ncbi:MAG: alpha-glucosidase [Planctomycetes bacterium]|nr:alpha-glucosidase [Planctomycetota bacterium]
MWRTDRNAVLIGDDVARFRDPAFAGMGLPPFPAYLETPRERGKLPTGWRVRPRFTKMGRRAVVEVAMAAGVSLYGTGEQAGPLLRNGIVKTLWNNDNFDYHDGSRHLYQSHPFVLCVREDGSAVGIIIETTHRCDIDLRRGVRAVVHGPSPAVTVIERADAMGVVRVLSELTGKMPMPPKWALGYQQCRWSYEPEGRVREVAAEFRERRIPCDVLWLDIDYMDGFRVFTFDREKFPDPAALNADLREMGFRTVYMIDPGVKVDPAYRVYAEARRGGHFIKTARGQEYHGEVWPGDCAFPDFTREATRRWWAGLYTEFFANGMDGVWNDMNEPAVFGGVEKTMPVSNRHEADAELGGPGDHARYHNIYGMQMVRATREGVLAAARRKRPFVLTRANFLGGHRYAATWTGDNRSDWRHLRWSIPMALNMGLCGQPFVGPDIGGFIGDADGALFARWMGIGALLPFARAHSEKTTQPHEPWVFGEACENSCRRALERRYRLLPYLYTCFRNAAVTGEPVVRPVFFADPTRRDLRAVDDAFLLGPDILVQCAVKPGERPGAPVLPWRKFEIASAGDEALPDLYLRPGAAVPVGPAKQYTDEPGPNEITLVAALKDGAAEGALYEDADDGWEFERGEYRLTTWRVTGAGAVAASSEGKWNGPSPRVGVRVV